VTRYWEFSTTSAWLDLTTMLTLARRLSNDDGKTDKAPHRRRRGSGSTSGNEVRGASSATRVKNSRATTHGEEGLVSSTNMKLTFENLVASILAVPGESLDKGSVAKMVRGLYDWAVFDPNLQLDLPSPPGKPASSKMWPHGSVVNSRRGLQDSTRDERSRKLEDLDADAASIVASSVVSGTLDDDRAYTSKGVVVEDASSARAQSPEIRFAKVANHQQHSWGEPPVWSNPPPPNGPPPPPPVSAWEDVPRVRERGRVAGGTELWGIPEWSVDESVPRVRDRVTPRFSIVGSGGIVPQPTRVVESPVPQPAALRTTKRTVRRVKTAGAKREDVAGDSGGCPVTFADDE